MQIKVYNIVFHISRITLSVPNKRIFKFVWVNCPYCPKFINGKIFGFYYFIGHR
jgi:hypothetical protein